MPEARRRQKTNHPNIAARQTKSRLENPYLAMAKGAAQKYERNCHLPALLALWPMELADFGPKGTAAIITRLEAALRTERRRARANHWCYDLNRHTALISALEGERRYLSTLAGGKLTRGKMHRPAK